MELPEYLHHIVNRILNDEWRVGWFKVEENIEINGVKCRYLLIGHSTYFKKYKPFFLSRILAYRIIPYGTLAVIFVVDYVDISIIEKIVKSVTEYMRKRTFKTPDDISWGIDIAYIAVVSAEIGRGVIEYVTKIFNGIVSDQYMIYRGFRGKINKRIGLTVVNYKSEEIYSSDDIISMEARRLFNPKLSIIEKFLSIFKKRDKGVVARLG